MGSGTPLCLWALTVLVLGVSPGHAGSLPGEEPSPPPLEDELSFLEQETVAAATGFTRPSFGSPANVWVVRRQDIERLAPRNIGDILSMVPGLDVYTFRGDEPFVFAGGLGGRYSNRLLILVDGAPYLTALYGTAPWRMIPVSPEDIERIEVVVGPATSLYGENAFAGVIDIVTRRGTGCETSSEGTFSMGSRGFQRGHVRASTGLRDGGVVAVRGFAEVSDNLPLTSLATGQAYPGSDQLEGTLRVVDVLVERRPAPGTVVGLEAAVAANDFGDVTNFVAQSVRAEDRAYHGALRVHRSLSPTRDAQLRLQFDRRTTVSDLATPSFVDPYWERTFDLDAHLSWDRGRVRSLAGLSWRDKCAEGLVLGPGEWGYAMRALYYQTEWDVRPRTTVFGSLRYSDGDLVEGDLSWKLDLRRSIGRVESLRLGGGRSFRSPDLLSLYFERVDYLPTLGSLTAPLIEGNPGLTDERIRTLQLGYERRTPTSLAKVDLFTHFVDDAIVTTSTGIPIYAGTPPVIYLGESVTFDNADSGLRSRGITAAWRRKFHPRWTFFLSGTVKRVTSDGLERDWYYAPRRRSTSWLEYELSPRNHLTLAHLHSSGAEADFYASDPALHETLPGYNRFDLAWRRSLPEGSLGLRVVNLFDDEVVGLVSLGSQKYAPTQGREYFLTWTVKF